MKLKSLLSASLLLAALAASAAAQDMAVEFRAGDAFKGPVESARVEQVAFSREDGVLVEGPRRLSAVSNYSPDGRRKEYEGYAPDGSVRTRRVHVFDEAGNEVELSAFDYDGDGSLRQRRVVSLSPDGTQVEMRLYDGGGDLKEQAAHVREAGAGAWYTYGPDGVLKREEARYSRDQAGRHRAESQTSAPKRTVVVWRRFSEVNPGASDPRAGKTRETREYDSRGNLLKMTSSKWNAETDEYEPSSVTYYTVTYYR